MRIDFEKAYKNYDFENANDRISDLKIEHWEEFGELIKESISEQMTLFWKKYERPTPYKNNSDFIAKPKVN